MPHVLEDLRFAVRTFFKNPASTLVAIFALTLGIGANTAIFSVVNAVLLKPLSYASPERLAILWEASPGKNIREFYVTPPDYKDWLEQSRSFEILNSIPVPSFDSDWRSPARAFGYRLSLTANV